MDTEINKVIAALGSQASLARAMRVSNNAVSKWVAQGYVPPGRAIAVASLVAALQPNKPPNITVESLLRDSYVLGGGRMHHLTKNTTKTKREDNNRDHDTNKYRN